MRKNGLFAKVASSVWIKLIRDGSLFVMIYIALESIGFVSAPLYNSVPFLAEHPWMRTLLLASISLSVVVFVRSFLTNFFSYLEMEDSPKESGITNEIRPSIEKELNQIRAELQSITRKNSDRETVKLDISDEVKADLLAQLETSIQRQMEEDSLSIFDKELARRDLRFKKWEESITDFSTIRDRLFLETQKLQRRANLNLFIGTSITILAGIGLLVIVFFRPFDLPVVSKEDYGWRLISHYIPRLSLIIFAEIFAYFFLRLYKNDLADIKYYQNEVTNVEMRLTALKTVLAVEQKELPKEDKEMLKTVVAALVGTERNFVLKKGETTIELEKFKQDGMNAKDWAGQLISALKSKS